MSLFSDLHLRPESADVCFQVLEGVAEACLKTQGREVAMLGDFWHVRYAVPMDLLNRVNDEFRRWSKLGIKTIILPGNHDQYNAHGRNALEFLDTIDNVDVYSEPKWDKHGLWLPYRQQEEQLIAALNSPKPPASNNVVFAHVGIKGAWMNSNIQDEDGLPQDVFAKFDKVLCGHYHKQQNVGSNITYLGSPWMTRADEAGQPKGFAEWDGKTLTRHNREYGRKFHKFEIQDGDQLNLSGISKADRVTIEAGRGVDAEALGKQLIEQGFEDIVVKPHIEEKDARLEVGDTSDLRNFAHSYAEQFCGELDAKELIAIFEKEIAQ